MWFRARWLVVWVLRGTGACSGWEVALWCVLGCRVRGGLRSICCLVRPLVYVKVVASRSSSMAVEVLTVSSEELPSSASPVWRGSSLVRLAPVWLGSSVRLGSTRCRFGGGLWLKVWLWLKVVLSGSR